MGVTLSRQTDTHRETDESHAVVWRTGTEAPITDQQQQLKMLAGVKPPVGVCHTRAGRKAGRQTDRLREREGGVCQEGLIIEAPCLGPFGALRCPSCVEVSAAGPSARGPSGPAQQHTTGKSRAGGERRRGGGAKGNG